MTLASDFAGLPPHVSTPAPGRDFSRYRIVPARYPARTIGTVLAAVAIFAILNSVLSNPRWGWDVFAEWFFAEPVLIGLGRTLLEVARPLGSR